MKRHMSILVKGRVQGVFYRASAKAKADEFGIVGSVQNLSDGSVYIEAEGTGENLDRFKDWCSHGPPHAHVTQVEINEGELRNYTTFEVVR